MDCSGEAYVGFVVAGCDAPELFEFLKEIFDQVAPFVHVDIIGDRLLAMGFGRNNGRCASFLQFYPQRVVVEGLIANEGVEVGAFDQRRHADAVVSLAWQ